MGRSLFTVGQRIWHRVQRPFGAVGGHNSHGHRSAAALSGCTDSEPSRQNRRGADRPLLLIQSMPRAMDQSLWPLPPKALVRPAEPDAYWRERYLFHQENCPRDIQRLEAILRMPRVLLEIGCGDAEAARQIALENPGTGIIATDLYAQAPCQSNGSGYGKTAWSWRQRLLPAQQDAPANLVILRAEADLLGFLPDRSVDTVFLLNPEPRVGKAFLAQLQAASWIPRIKQGLTRIVILPYSREMGLAACGGCGFEHDPDWSRGLGFIMGSGLAFRPGRPVQWGVDLSTISAYTRNSTQREVYVWGDVLS